LFKEKAVFLLKVFDDGLLMSVHPTSDCHEKELELGCHGAENLSAFPAAQSFPAYPPSFLVVQEGIVLLHWQRMLLILGSLRSRGFFAFEEFFPTALRIC